MIESECRALRSTSRPPPNDPCRGVTEPNAIVNRTWYRLKGPAREPRGRAGDVLDTQPLSRTFLTRTYEDARDTLDWPVGPIKSLAVSGCNKLYRLVESACDSSSAELSNGPAEASKCRPIAVRMLHGSQARVDVSAILVFEIGSGAGIRTLNLAVNSRLLYR